MFNILTLVVLCAVLWGGYKLIQHHTAPERQLARTAERLAAKAAQAAARGDYAEAERLDDARAAVLSRLSGAEWQMSGSRHDSYADHLLSED